MFNTTIWIRHDSETSARVREDPMDQLRDRVYGMEHNLETLIKDSFSSGCRSLGCARRSRRPSSHSCTA